MSRNEREGRCYELACKAVMADPSWRLVHGTVRGPYGAPIGHAWLQRGVRVFDPVLAAGFDAEDYAATFNASAWETFSPRDAAAIAVAARHFGPWDENEINNVLGHSKVSVTKRYSHPTATHRAARVERLLSGIR